uniref:Uncharacterized protein n=1 Tax=Panicum mosaic virus satellite RNA satC TaxID=2019555 RepID=A0A221C6B7_SPMV|nr:hypothetical protein [Panicum mosaic virus satellite RNA satC]
MFQLQVPSRARSRLIPLFPTGPHRNRNTYSCRNATGGEARVFVVDATPSSGCRLRGGLRWMPTDRPSSGQY